MMFYKKQNILGGIFVLALMHISIFNCVPFQIVLLECFFRYFNFEKC
jgi:hypothetical protein